MKANKNKIIMFISIIVIALIGLILISIYDKEIEESRLEEQEKKDLEDIYKESNNEDREILTQIKDKIQDGNNKESIEKTVSDVLSDFYYYINTNQYNEAYEMINEEYKEDFNLLYEKFESLYSNMPDREYFIEKITEKDKFIYVEHYDSYNDKYSKKHTTINKEDYSLTLHGVYNSKKANIKSKKENITIEIDKSMYIGNNIAYKINIINNSDEGILIEDFISSVSGQFGKEKLTYITLNYSNPNSDEAYTVESQTEKNYIIQFSTDNPLEQLDIKIKNYEEISLII